jgi:UDP-glucose 4-epimerase
VLLSTDTGLRKWLRDQAPSRSVNATGDPSARVCRRAAVIGADGFIGRHLATALYAEGVEIIGYTRQHDLFWSDDPAHRPDIVYYLASSITPALAEEHPELVTSDHLRFAALLSQLSRSVRPPTVVLTSSGGTVYDPDVPGASTEDTATRATSRYGAAKLALEALLATYADVLPGVVLRLSNVYGPGQRVGKSQGVLAYWLRAAAWGGPLHLIGDPRATRDYVYIHDVVECLLRIAGHTRYRGPGAPLVLNVASGVNTSLAELLRVVERVTGRRLPVKRMPHRAVDRRDCRLDAGRAAQVLGWRAHTPLLEGVAEMWRDFRYQYQIETTDIAAAS